MKLLGFLIFVLLVALATSKDQSKEYDKGSIYSSNSNYPSSSSLYNNRYPYSNNYNNRYPYSNNYNNRYPYNQDYSNGRYGSRYNGLSNNRDD
ncbi:unnamed protein product, partial [Mesorhabditis belari]|uniref:Prismalin-14 n=1 Tax=Mesorhabditis belari TaxID=2138241 RepID=A0AAF3FLL5_9BILA